MSPWCKCRFANPNHGGKIFLAAAALTRSSTGQPQQLGELFQFAPLFVDVHDVVWISESKLALLGRQTLNTSESLVQVQIGGPTESLNVMNELVGLTAARGRNSIVLVNKSGVLYEYASGAWRKFAEGVSWPAMSG